MTIFGTTKSLLKKMDLFSSMQFFRFKQDAETKTLTGGVISFSIISFLVVTFSNMMIDTFNKVLIYSAVDSNQAQEPPPITYSTFNGGKKFMLGIELWSYDLNNGPRYFDVTVTNSVLIQGVQSDQSVEYKLEPCTKSHWGGLSNIDKLYDRVGMSRWLCLPLDIQMTVSGKYSSEVQKSIDIVVSKCKNESDPSRPCVSSEQMEHFLRNNSQLYWSPFFLNPLLNPQSYEYLSFYLQDKYYVMSGPNYGSQLYIYNNDYQIVTDQSILPFPSDHNDTGPIISSVSSNTYLLQNSTDVYCLINFFRGPESVIIKRNYQKIIDAFAYIGGLLGSFVLLLIMLNFYNEHSFELNIAGALYQPEEGSPTTFGKYHIFYYLLQSIYSFFKKIKIKFDWEKVVFFHRAREEMVKQLDVMYLFKKIHILESAINLLFSKHQLRGLMLKHQMTIDEGKQIRKIYGSKKRLARILFKKIKQKEVEQEIRAAINNKRDSAMSSAKGVLPLSPIQGRLKERKKDDEIDNEKDANLGFQLEDFGSDSDSSDEGEEECYLSKEDQFLKDLSKLKEQSLMNNETSRSIFQEIDPRIKRALEKYTGFPLQLPEQLQKDPFRQQIVDLSEITMKQQLDGHLQYNKGRLIRTSKTGKRKRVHHHAELQLMKEPIDQMNSNLSFDQY